MGFDMKTDLMFSDDLVGMLFALEIQDLVENGRETEFIEVQESYGISPEGATAVVEAVCEKYVSQLLGTALGHARKYREAECVEATRRILQYAQYLSNTVDADGNVYNDNDKQRLISFYLSHLEAQTEEDGDMSIVTPQLRADIANKLRDMIVLSRHYIPPEIGAEGALGNDFSIDDSGSKSKKAWFAK
jgi:hypothetical protein